MFFSSHVQLLKHGVHRDVWIRAATSVAESDWCKAVESNPTPWASVKEYFKELTPKTVGTSKSGTIFILLIFYVFSKDRALDKKFSALEKGLQVTPELKVQDFIGQNKQQKEENEGWRQELEKTRE